MAIDKSHPIPLSSLDLSEELAAVGADETIAELLGTNNHNRTKASHSKVERWVKEIGDLFAGKGKTMPDGWTEEKDAAIEAKILGKSTRTRRASTRRV